MSEPFKPTPPAPQPPDDGRRKHSPFRTITYDRITTGGVAETRFTQAQLTHPIIHPEDRSNIASYRSDIAETRIRVLFQRDIPAQEMSLKDYCHHLRIPWKEVVEDIRKGRLHDPEDYFFRRHQEVIEQRRQAARRQHEMFHRPGSRGFESQESSVKEDDPVYALYLRDLQHDGVELADPNLVFDYLDKIDDVVRLDPVVFNGNGPAIYLGVQRSFDPEKARGDQKIFVSDPFYHVPEHPEWGMMLRVAVLEDLIDYRKGGTSDGDSFLTLLRERHQQRIREKEERLGRKLSKSEIPPMPLLSTVLPQGQLQFIEKHLEDFLQIRQQLEEARAILGDGRLRRAAVLERAITCVESLLSELRELRKSVRSAA